MNNTNTGKPESAFPSTFKSLSPEEGQVHRWGMTLRDYFAAKAMQSIVLTEHYQKMETPTFKYEYIGTALAEEAYRVADAMMEAREEC